MAGLVDMSWRDYQQIVRVQARERGIPAFGTFELTPLCNFNCKMCYVHLTPERMHELGRLRTAEEWLDMARQAADAGMVGVTLTGGEVLTRPDFEEIYAGIAEMGLFVSILSNGSLIDEHIVGLFRRIPPAHMRFTLYGASNETYERLCGVSDGFDRVMRNLRMLKEAGVDFTLSITETKLNIDDYNQVHQIAEEFGTSLIVGSSLVPAVRGAVSSALDLEVDAPIIPESETCPEVQLRTFPSRAECGPFAACGSYRTSFWLDWDGRMNMCSFMSKNSVLPFEIGFSRAWDNLLVNLASLGNPSECKECSVGNNCHICPGLMEAETGSPECAASRLCQRLREAVNGVG